MTTIGLVGSGDVAGFIARQLSKTYSLSTLDTSIRLLRFDSPQEFHVAAKVATGVDVVVLCTAIDETRDALLRNPDWLKAYSGEKRIVIDMGQADPDVTKAFATELLGAGITLVDAPLHTENTAVDSGPSAIFFGGPSDVLVLVRRVLEAVCPTIIHCGDAGNGHAMRLVVAAIASCNRLITYECAAMGIKNGLSISDMATVLNKSSGYNSASARVLPALAANEPTASVTLGSWADDLRKASALGMRCGAPMLIATMARSTLDAASNRLGETATVDKLAEIWEVDSGLGLPNAQQ